MHLNIQTTTSVEEVAEFLARGVLRQLNKEKKVLFFVTGGSSIAVGVRAVELLRNQISTGLAKLLTITITDERYGEVGHKDSNWQQLKDQGFGLKDAKFIPVLSGEDFETTISNFNKNLEREFKENKYKIGLFGIGADGHTAGILSASGAVLSPDSAFGYKTPTFSRITMTGQAISQLDEAVVFMQGKEKWPVLEDLEKDIDIIKQPAQILKKVPLLIIFTDFKNNYIVNEK